MDTKNPDMPDSPIWGGNYISSEKTYITPETSINLELLSSVTEVSYSIYYTIDMYTTKIYDGPFNIVGEGAHNLEYWAVDLVNNECEHKHLDLFVDGTNPSASLPTPT